MKTTTAILLAVCGLLVLQADANPYHRRRRTSDSEDDNGIDCNKIRNGRLLKCPDNKAFERELASVVGSTSECFQLTPALRGWYFSNARKGYLFSQCPSEWRNEQERSAHPRTRTPSDIFLRSLLSLPTKPGSDGLDGCRSLKTCESEDGKFCFKVSLPACFRA
jgi:hypothetical protein